MGDQERKPLDIENLEAADLEVEELEDVAGGIEIDAAAPNTGCGPNDGCNIPC
jgi:hypothetical protein